ncbi:MAG: hypothetical protein GX802_08285 [Clostridiales bacterium]|nr:hypothetical protein [Clostridiales bacterium]
MENTNVIKLQIIDERPYTYARICEAASAQKQIFMLPHVRDFASLNAEKIQQADCILANVTNSSSNIEVLHSLYSHNSVSAKLYILGDAFSKDEAAIVLEQYLSFAFVEPIPGEVIIKRIIEQMTTQPESNEIVQDSLNFYDSYFKQMELCAGVLLRDVGIGMHLQGFNYLRFAVTYFTFSPRATLKWDVFPKMEKIFNSSRVNIDRSMRYAIETAWNSGDINTQQELFGYTIDEEKGKPEVREFISMLGQHMRSKMLKLA